MKISTKDSSHRASVNGWGLREESYSDGLGKQITGVVGTLHGYIRAYSDDYKNDHTGRRYRSSSLRFIWKGKEYFRFFDGVAYSSRGLVTKARQFAEEIATQKEAR